MDVTPRKRARVITLSEHTYRLRERAENVGNCIEVNNQKELWTVSQKRKGNCGRKRKTASWTYACILRNIKVHPRTSRTDIQRDLLATVVNVALSAVKCTLFDLGRISRSPIKNSYLHLQCKKKTSLGLRNINHGIHKTGKRSNFFFLFFYIYSKYRNSLTLVKVCKNDEIYKIH